MTKLCIVSAYYTCFVRASLATDSISYYFQDSASRVYYKSLNGTLPSYLAQKLRYRSYTRSLRSVSNELLMQPRSLTKTYGDRAFAVHASREWNLIPYEIRKSNPILSSKRSPKTYLFTKFINNRSLFLYIYI